MNPSRVKEGRFLSRGRKGPGSNHEAVRCCAMLTPQYLHFLLWFLMCFLSPGLLLTAHISHERVRLSELSLNQQGILRLLAVTDSYLLVLVKGSRRRGEFTALFCPVRKFPCEVCGGKRAKERERAGGHIPSRTTKKADQEVLATLRTTVTPDRGLPL